MNRMIRNIRSTLRHRAWQACSGFCLLLVLAPNVLDARPFTVEDQLRMQSLGSIVASPSRELVAVLVSRPSEAGDFYRADANVRNDLVVFSVADGREVFRAGSAGAGSTVSAPAWSPDGRRLAYLLTRRDGGVSLQAWDADGAQARTLVADTVRAGFPPVRTGETQGPAGTFAWLNADEIVFTQDAGVQARALAGEAQSKARAERGEVSVRAWHTRALPLCRPEDRLSVVRLSDGAVTTIAQGPVRGASFSPDGHRVVVVTATAHLPLPAAAQLPVPFLSRTPDSPFLRWEAGVVERQGDRWVQTGARHAGTSDMSDFTLPRWRPDGSGWAFLDDTDMFATDAAVRLSQVRLGQEGVQTQTLPSRREGRAALAAVAAPPQTTAAGGAAGHAAGPPGPPEPPALPPAVAERLGPQAMQVGATRSDVRLYQGEANNASTLWAVHGAQARALIAVNRHLADVEVPQPVPVDYTVGGEERKGWLYLPADAAVPPPVVVSAYPLSRGLPPIMMTPGFADPALHTLLARGVAVYFADLRLQPPGVSDPDEPVARILSEMEANVAALKADSRVDADNLFFYGHSFGGYTALALLAHTAHFRGIVAYAPIGDLVGYAFSAARDDDLDPRCAAVPVLKKQMMHEYTGSSDTPPGGNLLMRMGGPPYALMDKYLRNSPLLDMGRATSPVLIIQGAEDGFDDSERLFNTLYRTGADAQLLYYPGEGHVLYGPGNVRDMTGRVVDWILERADPVR